MKTSPVPRYHSDMAPHQRLQELRRHRARKAESLLSDVLRSTDTVSLASAVWLTWPLAKTVMTEIAWFLTDRVLHPSGYTLLSLCVTKAFRRFERRRAELGTPADPRCLVAFIRGAMEALPAVIEVRIQDGGHEWNPLSGQPLGEFLEIHPHATVELVDPEGEAADRHPAYLRGLWLSQMLSSDDNAALAEYLVEICDNVEPV